MDDNHAPSLHTSQYEWAARLTRILQPLLYEGINAMFQEAVVICKQSDEAEKYLMTFQNILSRIPKWNDDIINKETERIIERSGCTHLEDLLTCVHIAQLKILTAVRTGKAQKKVEINIPKLSAFIHKAYIAVSRDIYSNAYLFETGVPPLVFQQNRYKTNDFIQVAVINVIRDGIPVEHLLRAYLDETTDLIKEKEVKEIPEKKAISFSDTDNAITVDNEKLVIDAPKDVENLQKISDIRNLERKEAETDSDTLKISNEIVNIDVEDLVKPEIKKDENIDLDIQILT